MTDFSFNAWREFSFNAQVGDKTVSGLFEDGYDKAIEDFITCEGDCGVTEIVKGSSECGHCDTPLKVRVP